MPTLRIVLVRTSHAGNIGAVARAMKTANLDTLYLVAPQADIDDTAYARARKGGAILQRARTVATLPEALADCQEVVGLSARARELGPTIMTPRAWITQTLRQPQQTAVVFGHERTGLTNEELSHCHNQIKIPMPNQTVSLNLASAVQVLCYEWSAQQYADALPETTSTPVADTISHKAHQELLAAWQASMIDCNFINAHNPGNILTKLNALLLRARLRNDELRILRGYLAALSKRNK